jgi:hypothetical protein
MLLAGNAGMVSYDSGPCRPAKIFVRVCAKINSQILSGKAPARQGAKIKAYPAYSVFSQRSFAGCMDGENVKLFLREPLRNVGTISYRPHPHRLVVIYSKTMLIRHQVFDLF